MSLAHQFLSAEYRLSRHMSLAALAHQSLSALFMPLMAPNIPHTPSAPMAVQPAAQSAGPMVPPSQQAAPQGRVRIVVEKARNLPSTESGCFCVAQGSSKEGQPKRTKVATGSSPVWAETFEVSVPSDGGDLVSVALWAGGAGGGYLGHVAVPMTRIEVRRHFPFPFLLVSAILIFSSLFKCN